MKWLTISLLLYCSILEASAQFAQYENAPLTYPSHAPTGEKYDSPVRITTHGSPPQGVKYILPDEASPDEADAEASDMSGEVAVATTLENYPNPLINPTACKRKNMDASYVCDPGTGTCQAATPLNSGTQNHMQTTSCPGHNQII